MIELFGHYRLDLPQAGTADFQLAIVPQAAPLPPDTSSLTAYFVADFFAFYFSEEALPGTNFSIREDLSSSINFVVNELVENAFKFHFDNRYEVTFSLKLSQAELIFCTGNRIDPHALQKFRAFIEEITVANPQDLLLKQIEQNMEEENNAVSGLGLLTIINDYGAKLGWKFESTESQPEKITVTTMVRLPISEEFYIMEFVKDDFQVWYEAQTKALHFKGSLRLGGVAEYAPLVELFNQVLALKPASLTLDLHELDFLNSSGINVISRFIITLRQHGDIKTNVLGSRKIPWQSKSLPNFQRLFPGLPLTFED